MDFSEAGRALGDLKSRKARGDLSGTQYAAELNRLRVQDADGRWWQPDPATGSWVFWNGSAWQPGVPPAPVGAADGGLMDMQEFREISRTQPWHKRPQKWWDLFSILGGCASAVIWFLYSGVRSNIEGFDLISPILMIGIPVFMVTYRTQLDDMLIPLQPHRKKFPKLLLVGAGIAVPFLTAFLLYNLFSVRQYPLMQWNMVIGTFTAYAITREPILAKGYQAAKGMSLKVPLFFIIFFSVIVRIVSGDDCLRDPLNARDCLRTQGYAEAIAGTASAAASTAINGPEIIRTLTQPPPPGEGPGQAGGEGTTPPLTPEEIAEEAQRQADEARRLAEWERQNEAGWQRFVEKGREGLTQDPRTGNWMSESVARDVARERAESALQQDLGRRLDTMRDQIQYGPHVFDPSRSDVMTRAIDGMLEQIRNGQEVSLDQYNRLRTAFGSDIMGHTLPPNQIPPAGENWSEILTDTVESSTREIVTGQDAAGNTSYSSIALRTILGGVTGGQSEWVYTPASSVYDMQDYVNKGGDSALEAWRRSAERAVIDEVTGRVVEGGINIAGNIGGRMLDNLADRYPGKAEWITKNLGDAHEYLTRERHLWGDDAARAASGTGDDLVRAASGSGDSAGRVVADQADTAGRTVADQADTAGRTVADQADTAGRTVADQADTAGRTVADQADTAGRTVADQADTAGRGASGQVDETARRASDAADGTSRRTQEEIDKLKDDLRRRIDNHRAQRAETQQLSPSMETTKPNLSADEVAHRGITSSEQQAIKDVSRENGAIIEVRPREPRAAELIATDKAVPKGPEVHVKTVKDVDIKHLGADADTRDLVVCRRPDPIPSSKPPDMSAREWRDLRSAHAQRTTEFINERPNLEQLVRDKKITWDPNGDGIIRDFQTGKPMTSDIDGFMIRDAANPNLPAPPEVQQRVIQDLRDRGIFQHDVHGNYDYSRYSREIPAGSPPGTLSDYQIAQNIDHRIIDASRTTNTDKGLLSFNGQSDTVDVVRYTGFTRNPHGLPG